MISALAWMRGVLVVVVSLTACMRTEHVTVPLVNEPGATCVETCRALSGVQAFQCLRRCPDAEISDGACVVPPPACVERRVISGRSVATVVGVVALPLLAVFVWYVVLDAGPTD